MPINISIKLGVIENIHVGFTCSPKEIQVYTSPFREFRDVFAWSYEEMPRIDPSIVVHEIPPIQVRSPCVSVYAQCIPEKL